MKRIGILTSGGDSPGMNAAIRAAVRTALQKGVEPFGFYHGWRGVMEENYQQMNTISVGGIITTGGTVLRTARCLEFIKPEGRQQALRSLNHLGIEGLVVIGGDGSLTGALKLYEETGFPVMGVPASIDNDIPCSDYSIGFDTAVNTALSAIDKVRDTAYSHDRVFVIEVMGRRNGFIAVDVGLAAGAEAIIIPEIPYSLHHISENLRAMRERGKKSSIIIVAEGAAHARDVRDTIQEHTGFEVRYMVLGHMQRGGSPTAHDRVLSLRLGAHAVECLLNGETGKMVGVRGRDLVTEDLEKVLSSKREIDVSKLNLVNTMSV